MRLVAVLALLLVLAPAHAADATGFWSGAIEAGGGLEVMIEIDAGTAKLFIPAQGVRGAAMIDVAIEGASFGAGIPGMPGEPRFVGTLSEDGREIVGDYTQAGRSFPFRLERGERPAELDIDIYAAFESRPTPGTGLPGRWRSIFEVGPHRYRMVLEVRSDETGGLSATLTNRDRGPETPQPLDAAAVDGRKVTLELGGGAGFVGTLSSDGSELDGEFSQAGQSFPMRFWRSGEE